MNHSRLHCIRLLIRGLLMLLCILSVPRLASSDPGTTAPNEELSPKRPKVFHQGAGYPAPSSVRMLRDSDDCATAKLDIWLKQGMMTYTISMHEDDLRFRRSARCGGSYDNLAHRRTGLSRPRTHPTRARRHDASID